MKKKFTFLMAALMLLTIIGLPGKAVGQEKTDELAYTIEFKDNGTSSDGSSAVSSIADVIASGSNYVNTISCTKVYQAKSGHGIKLGSSGDKGSIQLNFTTTGSYIGAIAATKIKINIKLIDTGKKVKVYINGSNTATELSPTTSFADYEISVNTTITSVKIEASNKSSNRFYIKDLKVYRTAAPAYTITAQSNNTNYGTVSLSGSVITGSPNSGYRYADPAYTISPANSATVSQNGNAFTVTPSANTTITINFEPIPTYTVTLNDNGAQLTEASAGAGVTLPSRNNVSPYTFAGWSSTSCGSQETTNAPASIIPAGTYHPTANITLYPVYTRTEGSGNTNSSNVIETGTYNSNDGTITWSIANIVSILQEQNGNSNTAPNSSYANATVRWYSGNKITITPSVSINSISATATTTGYATALANSTYTNASAAVDSNNNTEVIITPSNGSNAITIVMGGQSRLSSLTVNYATGTTYYISVVSTGVPTIVASNVDILYSATSGSIGYNIIDEPDPAGTLSAAVKAGTTSTITNLSFGIITDDEVPFTCDANNAFSAHTATVTLTYTYGNNETVTKDVTITQDATPIVLSSITLSGTYPIEFIQDDAFSSTGIVVTAHYNDESSSNVTSNATFSGYDMSMIGEQTVTVSYTESGVTKTATYTITVNAIPNKTIAQFISDEGGKCYLTGTVSDIVNTTYGNFDLTDESGTIYVYGCLTSTGASGQFSTLGIEEDDVIKVLANEYLYYNNTTHEAKNVKFIEKIVPNPQTLTVNATNGSVEITGKTLVNGSCEVAEGANVTATATPADHYTFTSWSATGVTLANNTANPLTFTMPTNGVTLTANFTENAKHNATFYVLGVEYGTDANVYEGSAITFPSVTAPNGYTFMGWTTAAIVGTQDGAPATLVTAANMGNANIDYYAVFAIQTGGDEGTVELTNSTIQTNREGKTSYGNYTIGDWSGKFMINKNGEVYSLQLGYNASSSASAYNSHLTTPECPYNITSITISTNNNTASGRTFYLCSASNLGTASSTDATYGYGSTSSANGSVTINVNGNTKQFHIYPDGTAYIASVSIAYRNVSYSSYCTSVSSQTAISGTITEGHLTTDGTIAAGTAVSLTAPLTINSGKKLTVNGALGNDDPANLIIEDGGQLICNNSVAATVKKSITASTASKGEGWYTISSPVNNKTAGGKNYETVAGVTNLVPATGKYDLYRFNETKDDSDEDNKRWENYKVHKYDLEMGRGYIYRKNSSDELSFVGNTNVGNITYTLTCSYVPELAGFNLIGNPYPHSIAKGSGKAIQNGDYLATNYYVLSNNDTWALCTDGSEIPSKQGILVQTVEGFNLTISDTPFTPVPGKYSNDNIRFSVANEQYEDVAYAWFDKGYGLNKIAHRNPDAPMLYIPQDGTNYATAIMSDDIKVFGLSFKAMTMGKYTLRTKANGDYTYLHVIDRLTGEDVDMLLDGEYSFVASPNDKENRFIVKLEYKPDYSEGNSDIFAYQSGSEILVSGEGELQIFDVTGRNVMTTIINGAEAINGLSNGVYIFRLVGNDIKTQKIVVR